MKNTRNRVLVFQIGSIGDTVVTVPALKAIRRHFGTQSEIVLLHHLSPEVNVTPRDILAGSSLVDDFLSYPLYSDFRRRAITLQSLIRQIRKLSFDTAVYLAPSIRQPLAVTRDKFTFRLFGIRELIGFRTSPSVNSYSTKERASHPKHEALLRLDRLKADGLDVSIEEDLSKPFLTLPEAALGEAEKWLADNRRQKKREMVAVFPGCKQQANSWPLERFIEIGERLADLGRFEIVVGGGPAEKKLGDYMVNKWGEGINAAGRLSVLGSAGLISRCSFLIGLDTGTTHLAAAMGIPCVVAFGSQAPRGLWYPLGSGHTILTSDTPCARCGLSVCPLPHHPCMTGITLDRVWEAVVKMIQPAPCQAPAGSEIVHTCDPAAISLY